MMLEVSDKCAGSPDEEQVNSIERRWLKNQILRKTVNKSFSGRQREYSGQVNTFPKDWGQGGDLMRCGGEGRISQFKSIESGEEARGGLDVESVGGTLSDMVSRIQQRMAAHSCLEWLSR